MKYKLTDETKILDDGTVLYRIIALREGPWGPAGTKGGWIEKEENLSQNGDCWVYYYAKVYGDAWVKENKHYKTGSYYKNLEKQESIQKPIKPEQNHEVKKAKPQKLEVSYEEKVQETLEHLITANFS